MTNFSNIFLAITSLLLLMSSCSKPIEYPLEPKLSFAEYYAKKDSVDGFNNKSKYLKLKYILTDGDGDIGFYEGTLSPEGRAEDLYSTIYYKKDGELHEFEQYKITRSMIDTLAQMHYPAGLLQSLEILLDLDKEKSHSNPASIDFLFSSHLDEYDYEMYHDILIRFSKNTDFLYYNMPFLEQSTGQNKSIKTDLILEMSFTLGKYEEMPYDTLVYETYVYDRAFNKSNVLRTPEIIFK